MRKKTKSIKREGREKPLLDWRQGAMQRKKGGIFIRGSTTKNQRPLKLGELGLTSVNVWKRDQGFQGRDFLPQTKRVTRGEIAEGRGARIS